MSEEKLKKTLVGKIQWAAVIIATLSLLVAFMGINFQGISSYISETMFPKADYTLESVTTPTILSTDFRESLSVSPEYFVVTIVNLKSETPYQGEPMQLSISFDDKGKKSVEQPRILVFFADYMYRVWSAWNESVTSDVLTRGCNLEYHFPPLDQKITGDWSIFVLLYDDAENTLVSYALRQLPVTDIAPLPWWQNWTLILAISGLIVMSTFPLYMFISDSEWYEHRRKRKKKSQA